MIISSQGIVLLDNRPSAEIVARILSEFETEAVQVFKDGKPITAYFQQRECQLLDDGFYWELTVEGQHMSEKFPFMNI